MEERFCLTGSCLAAPEWIVRSLWVGGPLSELEWVCLTSFRHHGAQVELFTDDLTRRVPEGVRLRDCREVLGGGLPRYGPRAGRHEGSLAMAGNVARLNTLFREGGWWVDTDVVCLAPFHPIDSGCRFAWEDLEKGPKGEGKINCAVIRFPKGHRIIQALMRRTRWPLFGSPWESFRERRHRFFKLFDTLWDPWNVPWSSTAGPIAFTLALDHFGLKQEAMPPAAFYPMHYSEWDRIPSLSREAFAALAEGSYALHLWAEMYRNYGVDKGEAIRGSAWAQPYLAGFGEG